MKNIVKKILVIMLLTVIMFMIYSQTVQATWVGDVRTAVEDQATPDNAGDAGTKTAKIVGAIIYITRIIGVGVAIIMLTAVAIKYLSAAPGDKADIKKHAVTYVVGAVVLFASSGILTIIQNFSKAI